MSLIFIDREEQTIADFQDATMAKVVEIPLSSKAELLIGLGRALGFPQHFQGDSVDAFYDCLTDTQGKVILRNGSAWWQYDPQLMGSICQSFLDAGDDVWLACAV